MIAPREVHIRVLMTLVKYITDTKERGLVLAPNDIWSTTFTFKIHGSLDFDYMTNLYDHRSTLGDRVLVNNTLICFWNIMQKVVTLSMMEEEIAVGIMAAQDMMSVYRLLQSLELQVELPIVLKMNNSGTVNIANSWSEGSRMHHVVHNCFLHWLKDQGLLVIRYIAGKMNDTDNLTKNMTSAVFNKHVQLYVWQDEYMSVNDQDSSKEAVTWNWGGKWGFWSCKTQSRLKCKLYIDSLNHIPRY